MHAPHGRDDDSKESVALHQRPLNYLHISRDFLRELEYLTFTVAADGLNSAHTNAEDVLFPSHNSLAFKSVT